MVILISYGVIKNLSFKKKVTFTKETIKSSLEKIALGLGMLPQPISPLQTPPPGSSTQN